MSTDELDVLVAGGGPVGLATAIEAARRGLRVAVVEPREGVVDKACGEGLMPAAVSRLRDLGVEVAGRPFVGIRYLADGRSAQARFRRGPGQGVRRTVLHAALSARADRLGVRRVTGRVRDVRDCGSRVEAAGMQARWLVAADGLHSTVRREVGLDRPTAGPSRYGLRRHFGMAPWTDHVEVYWSPHVEAYVTPVADDLVGVAVLGPAGTGYASALAELPALAARLRGAAPVTAVRGAGPLRQRATRVRAGRVLLVGDAAGYVDALTGEGLSTGLASATAAVAALASGRPAGYEWAWARSTRRYRLLTEVLLAAAARPGPRAALVPLAAGWPRGFAAAVNLLA
ncbi:MAG TPA: NAD(P)/FAD-dependent oxidoreductase [Actinomycetes bacterium]